MVLFTCVLAIGVLLFHSHAIFAFEMVYDQVSFQNTTDSGKYFNFTMFRIAKFNRTLYVFNGDVDLLLDIDGNFYAELSFHYNRLNNNQYNKSPMRVPRENLCSLLRKYYGFFTAATTEEQTNLPRLKPGENICPIKSVHFDISKLISHHQFM